MPGARAKAAAHVRVQSPHAPAAAGPTALSWCARQAPAGKAYLRLASRFGSMCREGLMQVSEDPAAHVQCGGGGLLQQAYSPACLYSPGTFGNPVHSAQHCSHGYIMRLSAMPHAYVSCRLCDTQPCSLSMLSLCLYGAYARARAPARPAELGAGHFGQADGHCRGRVHPHRAASAQPVARRGC